MDRYVVEKRVAYGRVTYVVYRDEDRIACRCDELGLAHLMADLLNAHFGVTVAS